MASYTTNYNLKKPEGTDFINIQDLNDNADIIDREIKAASSSGMAKVTGAKVGNMAQFTADGGIEDSGLKFSIYNGGLRVTYDDGL
ncbi:MAG: hypothetical protein AB7E42_08685 [Anaerotignaceae bacterium]